MASAGSAPSLALMYASDLRRIRSAEDDIVIQDARRAAGRVRRGHEPRRSESQAQRSYGSARDFPPLRSLQASPDILRIPPARLPASPPPTAMPWRVPIATTPVYDPFPEEHAPVAAVNAHADADAPPARPTPPPRGLIGKLAVLLGFAGANARERRALLSLFYSLAFGVAQFVIIVTLLAYSAHIESPTKPGVSEWDACERPLGAWNALWLIRVVLGCTLAGWEFSRERRARQIQTRRDAEAVSSPGSPFSPRGGRPTPQSPQTGRPNTGTNQNNLNVNAILGHSPGYSRLSVFTSFVAVAWFLTAHVLEYTSVNTCRFSAPHIWWLTFGILCILYLMVLEIFLLGLLVFILGPVLYLMWNILLLCLGRHPLQNPHYINPDIGKLPKAVVNEIPLVLYIPPPPPGEDDDKAKSTEGPITVPTPAYSYPPKVSPPARRKPRFAWLRRKKTIKGGAQTGGGDSEGPTGTGEWEDMWERGEYPFVRLEENRAACAICLCDFEEPKRIAGKEGTSAAAQDAKASGTTGAASEHRVEDVTEEERAALRLDDAGEGAQPLRLLSCGHVFHKTCLDPWLMDVSGRCPTCQRPVEITRAGKKKGGQRGTPRT